MKLSCLTHDPKSPGEELLGTPRTSPRAGEVTAGHHRDLGTSGLGVYTPAFPWGQGWPPGASPLSCSPAAGPGDRELVHTVSIPSL